MILRDTAPYTSLPHNGVNPQDVKVFHNTIWSATSTGCLRLFNPHPNYAQYCYSNAVFSTQAISNFINQSDNFTDSYENADKYFLNASKSLSETNLYPQTGQLKRNYDRPEHFSKSNCL
ncbi:MAG: hypothetical protein IPI30_19110 [Saprospiraceae bacterium]|nr:hypothetical protein [Candidatus Vicinibacter affinis]